MFVYNFSEMKRFCFTIPYHDTQLRKKALLILIIKFGLWPCPYQSFASLCLLCYTNSELHDLHIILYNTLLHAGCPKI